jgi:hypothetical protein
MPLNSNNWISVKTPITDGEFRTHLNYLKCIRHLSLNLTLKTNNISPLSNKPVTSVAKKKATLIKLTKENIDAEMNQINDFIEYSQICISWIPVKSYYLFFNELILLLYLITDDDKWLLEDHKKIHMKLKELIRNKNINFSSTDFNTIYIPSRILEWKIQSGNNVIRNNLNYQSLERQLIKKMFAYCKEDYKRSKSIKSLSGNNKSKFLNSTVINLCEFFYWYRLKANYRDMEFVNSNVDLIDFKSFYSEYYNLSINFYSCMKSEINKLSQLRYQKDLI